MLDDNHLITPSTVPGVAGLNLRKVMNNRGRINHRTDRRNCGRKRKVVCFCWQNAFKSLRVGDFYMNKYRLLCFCSTCSWSNPKAHQFWPIAAMV